MLDFTQNHRIHLARKIRPKYDERSENGFTNQPHFCLHYFLIWCNTEEKVKMSMARGKSLGQFIGSTTNSCMTYNVSKCLFTKLLTVEALDIFDFLTSSVLTVVGTMCCFFSVLHDQKKTWKLIDFSCKRSHSVSFFFFFLAQIVSCIINWPVVITY